MTVLLDGDVIVYKCCFSAKNCDFIQTVEKTDSFIRDILVFCGTESLKVFLTGKNNFREKVAVTQPYKGSRDSSKRPRYYKAIRDYLVDFYNAEVIDGYEADDALGVAQNGETIIATIDKDLQQIPGLHLNFYKSSNLWEIKTVEEDEASKFFWGQCLIGDKQDDIIGIPGLGEKKTEKLFAGKSVNELRDVVINEYVRYYGDNGFARFDETARLLFIKRISLETEYYHIYK